MSKIQNFSEIQQKIGFDEIDFYQNFNKSFKNTELGRIKSLLPLREMAIKMGLVEEFPKSLRTKRGRKAYFSPEGKIALLFLQSYTGLSAPKLMENLNANIHYQLFCGIRIDPQNPMTNHKLINSIVLELSKKIRIQELQELFAKTWLPYMKNLDTVYTDATCYESLMRFPTDVKLLWECAEDVYGMMCKISSSLGERRLRTKFNDIQKANLVYRKQRRHTKKQTRRMLQRILALLNKMLNEVRRQLREHEGEGLLSKREITTLNIITKAYRQQNNHFKSGNTRENIKGRIVSISKPYIRPIVRGKETKKVEFGAKCNNIQIDQISFIEKISFNPFYEGSQLKHCISLSEKLTGVKVKNIAGDQGYSSNANRTLCRQRGISTSFAQKGRKNKINIAHKQELSRTRATAMEGSFGTQKEHYGLKKIVARVKSTELLMIFLGIHTANLVLLSKRIEKREKEIAVAA